MLKQASARRAEKALQEILHKADHDSNGRVKLKDYLEILEVNDIKMNECELEAFVKISDENGEISKNDIIIQTKQSSFWKGNMDLKNLPGSHSTKVEIMNKTDKTVGKVDTAFRMFDKNRDGFITKDEFAQVSKTLSKEQIEAVFAKFDANKDGKLSKDEFKNLMENRK